MKHIDKVFKDKLYNHKTPVPDGMWDKIAPAIEDKPGRSILWFWFAGVIAVLLAGLGYLLFANGGLGANVTPLALDSTNSTSEIIAVEDISSIPTATQLPKTEKEISKTVELIDAESEKLKVSNTTEQPKYTPSSANTKVSKPSVKLNEKIEVVSAKSDNRTNTDNLYGKPANLVITKSYVSEKGSVIEQSNTINQMSETPSYNVFINSEGMNAGALMRVIEPLENIPLPAFTSPVKKKISL